MNRSATETAANLVRDWAGPIRARQTDGGPEWLSALRERAATEFLSGGLPGNKDEAWKYTSLRRFEELSPELGSAARARDNGDWTSLVPQAGGFGFRFVDGNLQWLQQDAPEGVSMLALADVFSQRESEDQQPLRALLEATELDGRSHAFEALNTAMLSQGVIIHVRAGVDAGLCHAHWCSGAGASPRFENFRFVVILEPGAKLSLLEQFQQAAPQGSQQGSRGQALNLVLQIQLADGASMQHVRLQSEAAENILFTFSQVEQARRSSYTCAAFDIGGALVRHSLNCRLTGPSARARVNGAFVLDHDRHVDHHICIDHMAPSCASEQFFRGVLGGHSRGVFNGRAVIRPGADGSQVRQSNANLLLSEHAEIDTKPELEIYADEVEASHGATVGSLDEQAVFYLRSRGLGESAARRMLTSAFCRTVTDRLADADLAEQVAGLLEAALPEAGSNAEEKS